MHDKRPQADRILVAAIWGEARHRAKWREMSSGEEAAAVAALGELTAGRADLLAEVAGILEGTSEGELDESPARCAAGLCRKAGAGVEAIPAWIEEGRRRAAQARQPPFSGGLPGLLRCPLTAEQAVRHDSRSPAAGSAAGVMPVGHPAARRRLVGSQGHPVAGAFTEALGPDYALHAPSARRYSSSTMCRRIAASWAGVCPCR
jgi:hypothetical protein